MVYSLSFLTVDKEDANTTWEMHMLICNSDFFRDDSELVMNGSRETCSLHYHANSM